MKPKRILYTGALVLMSATLLGSCGILSDTTFGGHKKSTLPESSQQIMLIGSMGRTSESGAIQSFSINPTTLTAEHTATFDISSPTYMALSDDGNKLYVTNELSKDATLSALNLDRLSGELTMLNQTYTIGTEPTYVSVRGNKAITANYGGGSISLMYLEPDGSLGPADWQINLSNGDGNTSHPHAVVLSRDGKDLYVPDLAQDKIFHFNIHRNVPPITISSDFVELPKGSGPRHLVFDSRNKYAYLVCELKPMVYVLSYDDATGSLAIIQEIRTNARSEVGGGHIALSKDGKFLYTSHRDGGDAIITFSIDQSSGKLTYVGSTPVKQHPRQFAVSPDNQFIAVACRDANVVDIYKRNIETGMLEKSNLSIRTDKPVFVLWEDFSK